MPDLRCKCGSKIAEYDDYEVRIKHRRCGDITILKVVDGKITLPEPMEKFKISIHCESPCVSCLDTSGCYIDGTHVTYCHEYDKWKNSDTREEIYGRSPVEAAFPYIIELMKLK
jgi:hypothetical protein